MNEPMLRPSTTALIPGSLAEIMQVAEMLSKSEMVPVHYQGEPGNIMAAIQLGSELGIPPMTMLQNSYPVNNRIGLYTDLLVGIVMSQPDYDGQQIVQDDDKGFEIILYKRLVSGERDEYHGRFALDDAIRAGMPIEDKKSPWYRYRSRMFRHRACAFAVRNGWPNRLAGIYTMEELISGTADASVELRDVSPAPETGLAAPEVPANSVVVLSDPVMERIIAAAKAAKLKPKEIQELKTRWKNVKNNERGAKAFEVSVLAELSMRANRKPVVVKE